MTELLTLDEVAGRLLDLYASVMAGLGVPLSAGLVDVSVEL